jgi:hypothetical protein
LQDDRVLREFGTQQCLAVHLDGTSLPDEVYADLDFEAVVAELGEAAGAGSYRGFSQGPEETGLFFFGRDADAMFSRVEPVLRRLPIGQNARVVIRFGKASLNPREVRMPRHERDRDYEIKFLWPRRCCPSTELKLGAAYRPAYPRCP